MVKLALAFILGLTFMSPVNAQESKAFIAWQPCDTPDKMLATMSKYNETPLFTGSGIQFAAEDNTPYRGDSIFFVNQDTGTWSLISVYPDGTVCMIAVGKDFIPYSLNSTEGDTEEDGY